MRNTYLYLLVGLLIVGLIVMFGHPEAQDFSTGQIASLAFLAVALMFVMGGGGLQTLVKGRAAIEAIALWVAIIALTTVIYTFKDEMKLTAARVAGSLSGQGAQMSAGKRVELYKANNHFTARVNVNNKPEIAMMVDTGASLISLSYEDAQALGFPVELLVFDRESNTANGKALSAGLTLDVVRIGEIELTSVKASISQRGAMKGSLLGMSFLERLQAYGVEEGVMVLKAR
jgi:aspartyl protease family protein